MNSNALKILLSGKKYLLLLGPFFRDLAGWRHRHDVPKYHHHKSSSPWYEARCWPCAAWRKKLYAFRLRNVLQQLQTELGQRYYLAILQVYNDSQIRNHSPYKDIRDYINDVMHSYAKKAPKRESLVIKHHPMDRGHRLYGLLIRQLGKKIWHQ
ncbi:Capsule polysaccharide biosynthesis protein [Serratia proteamaculans]|nr:Capsule polysaccharide biosynthesis protein [Serratia proteamaculans]